MEAKNIIKIKKSSFTIFHWLISIGFIVYQPIVGYLKLNIFQILKDCLKYSVVLYQSANYERGTV